jgi:hypothetical protein
MGYLAAGTRTKSRTQLLRFSVVKFAVAQSKEVEARGSEGEAGGLGVKMSIGRGVRAELVEGGVGVSVGDSALKETPFLPLE